MSNKSVTVDEHVTMQDGYGSTHQRDLSGREAGDHILVNYSDCGVRERHSSSAHQTNPKTDEQCHNYVTSGEYTVITDAENEIEAHRIHNNYLFGFKKWKSHVTERPLSARSEIVQDLYADTDKIRPVRVSTLRPTNLMYVVLIGWWLALVYAFLSAIMFLTVIGRDYSHLCIKLARFFFWPFGKYVHQIHLVPLRSVANLPLRENCNESQNDASREGMPLFQAPSRGFWKRFDTYAWLLFAVPSLLVIHSAVFLVTWLLVITIPIAKLNLKTITKLIYLPPAEIDVGDSGIIDLDLDKQHSEILMYTHQSVNFYYYKLTIDGMNVILVNLLIFVVLALALGYGDPDNKVTGSITKFVLASLAIIPLTYYIGMSIASISAQSVLAVGAVLNATFGSVVEIALYIIMMVKGAAIKDMCYTEFVKSSMTGTLLVTILFIPGICMMIGGLKFRSQKFNPASVSVSASLLFVSALGAFAPSLFADLFGTLSCSQCERYTPDAPIGINATNGTGFECSNCKHSIFGLGNDMTLYTDHILPLVYAIAIILPVSYVIGLVFTLKTHTSHIYDQFNADNAPSFGNHGSAQWGRIKCAVILMVSATLISLCAEIITQHLQPILTASGLSEYFIGVTLLAVIPELPEVVNGIQFALQDNVSLGIEVGSSTAVQVCLIQMPLMVLVTLIYPPFSFQLIFSTIHLWVVIFSVLLFNYVVMDGKSDYFQGSMLVLVYIIMMVMYFFCPVPEEAKCGKV